jgi:ATP-dependent DNA ligase
VLAGFLVSRQLSVSVGTTSRPPKWIKPQLTRLVDEAPAGEGWLHEIKYDGYRSTPELMAARSSC